MCISVSVAIMGLFQRFLGNTICDAQQNWSLFLSGINARKAIQYVDDLK